MGSIVIGFGRVLGVDPRLQSLCIILFSHSISLSLQLLQFLSSVSGPLLPTIAVETALSDVALSPMSCLPLLRSHLTWAPSPAGSDFSITAPATRGSFQSYSQCSYRLRDSHGLLADLWATEDRDSREDRRV